MGFLPVFAILSWAKPGKLIQKFLQNFSFQGQEPDRIEMSFWDEFSRDEFSSETVTRTKCRFLENSSNVDFGWVFQTSTCNKPQIY